MPNLHRVTDALYRGAQPIPTGMRQLHELGVKTIVNLRRHHTDRDEISGLALDIVEIPTNAWSVTDAQAVAFLQAVTDPARQPVFVHCQHGADRTGAMCAVYRVVVQGWSKDEAVLEMTRGGYGYHALFGNLPKFVRGIDVAAMRRRVGLDR